LRVFGRLQRPDRPGFTPEFPVHGAICLALVTLNDRIVNLQNRPRKPVASLSDAGKYAFEKLAQIPLANLSHLFVFCDDGIGEGADAVDLDRHAVAGLQEHGGLAGSAYAVRCAGQNHCAGCEPRTAA
jgi:hypothetical protein